MHIDALFLFLFSLFLNAKRPFPGRSRHHQSKLSPITDEAELWPKKTAKILTISRRNSKAGKPSLPCTGASHELNEFSQHHSALAEQAGISIHGAANSVSDLGGGLVMVDALRTW